jgi:hypothetical protein
LNGVGVARSVQSFCLVRDFFSLNWVKVRFGITKMGLASDVSGGRPSSRSEIMSAFRAFVLPRDGENRIASLHRWAFVSLHARGGFPVLSLSRSVPTRASMAFPLASMPNEKLPDSEKPSKRSPIAKFATLIEFPLAPTCAQTHPAAGTSQRSVFRVLQERHEHSNMRAIADGLKSAEI